MLPHAHTHTHLSMITFWRKTALFCVWSWYLCMCHFSFYTFKLIISARKKGNGCMTSYMHQWTRILFFISLLNYKREFKINVKNANSTKAKTDLGFKTHCVLKVTQKRCHKIWEWKKRHSTFPSAFSKSQEKYKCAAQTLSLFTQGRFKIGHNFSALLKVLISPEYKLRTALWTVHFGYTIYHGITMG